MTDTAGGLLSGKSVEEAVSSAVIGAGVGGLVGEVLPSHTAGLIAEGTTNAASSIAKGIASGQQFKDIAFNVSLDVVRAVGGQLLREQREMMEPVAEKAELDQSRFVEDEYKTNPDGTKSYASDRFGDASGSSTTRANRQQHTHSKATTEPLRRSPAAAAASMSTDQELDIDALLSEISSYSLRPEWLQGTATTSSTTTGDGATGELPVDTLMDEAQRLQRIETSKELILRAHPEFTDADVMAEWSQPSHRAIEIGRKVHSESRSAALSVVATTTTQIQESLLDPLNSAMGYVHDHLTQPLEDRLRQIPHPKVQFGFFLKDRASDALHDGTQRLTLGVQGRLTDWSGSAMFGETVEPVATAGLLMAATGGLARGMLKVPALARSGIHKVQQYELKFHPGVVSSNGAGSVSIQKRSTAYQGRARGKPHLGNELPKEMTVGSYQGPRFPTLREHAAKNGKGMSSTEYYGRTLRHIQDCSDPSQRKGIQVQFYHKKTHITQTGKDSFTITKEAGQDKLAHITRTGKDSFTITSTTLNQKRIYTHFEGYTQKKLSELGITLPKGF